MKKPLVSIIIVNWNGGEVLKDCLKTLGKLKYRNWGLIVVDNGSTDNSVEWVRKLKIPNRKLQIIENEENVGFAKANNQGYEKASGKYILLLNNDTKVRPDLLDILVKKMESDREVGVIQPKIELMERKGYLDNCGSFLTRTGLLQHWGYGEKDGVEFNREREIFSAKGACMMIRASLIDQIGLFDPDFGSYFEESDFCWRVWMAGKKVLYFPKTKILHKVGYTSKRMDQVKVTLISTRNRISSIFKNLGAVNLVLIFMPHVGFIVLLGTYYLVKLQIRKAWMMYWAVVWNIIFLPKLILKRIGVQRMRKKMDREIFSVIVQRVDMTEMFRHFRKVEANF